MNLGWAEVGIILILVLVVFGPKKIPELGGALGKTLRGFKQELDNPAEESDDLEADEEHDRR